ncbi:hypothetical protein EYF80_059772 [Liparis tanakae]|uniref:Uncharacterized protein n=1 Tax=Liparis tanakae TaxID=230148 RepID=A0A4Z2EM99_9TELE|nr:hypothetical protein EYF80_059772 [Liparis tanakae]
MPVPSAGSFCRFPLPTPGPRVPSPTP